MKISSRVIGFITLVTIVVTVKAEVPKKILEQALADTAAAVEWAGEASSPQILEEAKRELMAAESPMNLSPSALSDYENGRLELDSLVLQETVKDTEMLMKATKLEVPFLAKYYLAQFTKKEFNLEQRILCYMSLKVVQRKLLSELGE